MEIYATRLLQNIDFTSFELLAEKIDRERREAVYAIRDPYTAMTSLFSRLLTRRVLTKRLNRDFPDIQISYTQYGKPYLPDVPSFHFNSAHSGDWVVCVTDTTPAGIDIEKIDARSVFNGTDIFSCEEKKIYDSLENSEKLFFFFDIWTRKESYLKALGTGLNIPLAGVTTLPDGKAAYFPVIDTTPRGSFTIKHYTIDPSHRMAVCASHTNYPESVAMVNGEDFFHLKSLI